MPFDVIDAHVHTYPSAAIGLQATGGANYSRCAGTVQELLALMSVGGIDKAAMMNMTPVADMREAALASGKGSPDEIAREMIARMKRRNDWTCQTAKEQPCLVPFISLDPSMGAEEAVAEVRRCREQGAVGIKLHPSSQRFNPDDPNLWPVYAEAESLEMPVLSHGGVFPADPESSDFSRPKAFARVLKAFPKLRFVLAHMGQGYLEESLAMAEEFENIHFDSSSVITGTLWPPELSDDEIVAMVRRFGAERILFASDWPWYHPLRDLERIETLALSKEERRLILGENARRVMGI
jgi:predicted TIM-barrel fold metal-dependent hydrolase